jgi:hypothetical protein
MKCPYCSKPINALTGFQEAEKFAKHLAKCKKKPSSRRCDLKSALDIREESGQ